MSCGRTGPGAFEQKSSLSVFDSVVHAGFTNTFAYTVDDGAAITADYNFYALQPGARLAENTSFTIEYENMKKWQADTGADTHSVLEDPLFINPSSGDFHLRSAGGRFVPSSGSYVNDSNTSWAIDAGRWSEGAGEEPLPNGGRLNVGLYGGTAQASRSITNATDRGLLVVSLDDGGLTPRETDVGGIQTLYWLTRSFSTSDLVYLEFSPNNGLDWVVIGSNVNALGGEFPWDTTLHTSTPLGRWRITSQTDGTSATNGTNFVLRLDPFVFYVNDSNTSCDVYSCAPGAATNDGLSCNTPVDSLSAILETYDLEPGDSVLVDAGAYPVASPIAWRRDDGGTVAEPVVLIGATNSGGCQSVFVGQESNEVALSLFRAEHIDISQIEIEGGDAGVLIDQAVSITMSNSSIKNVSGIGLNVLVSAGHTFERLTISDNGGAAVSGAALGGAEFVNCVLWSNGGPSFVLASSAITVSNSVLYGSGSNVCYDLTQSRVVSDHNDLFVTDGGDYASIDGLTIESLPQWTVITTQDLFSLSISPGFFNAAQGDYHPVSQQGRYDPVSEQFVTTDGSYSPLIDTGGRTDTFSEESLPHGGVRNIGVYGDTIQASRSRTFPWMMALTASSGGSHFRHIFPHLGLGGI